jgi:hypothetical protein
MKYNIICYITYNNLPHVRVASDLLHVSDLLDFEGTEKPPKCIKFLTTLFPWFISYIIFHNEILWMNINKPEVRYTVLDTSVTQQMKLGCLSKMIRCNPTRYDSTGGMWVVQQPSHQPCSVGDLWTRTGNGI